MLLLLPLATAFSPLAAQQSQPSSQSSSPAASSGSSGGTTDVQVSKETKTTTWYASPTWIILGLVVLALIIVLVSVGRSRTTVIKN
jgi:cobalamin biosynthesis Mg chelatase CobN